MNIKPLGDRLLVKVVVAEDVTPSGIVLPETVDKEKKAEGIIVALGAGEKVQALGVKEKETVIFGKYAGDEVTIENEEYKILSHEDVLAVYTS